MPYSPREQVQDRPSSRPEAQRWTARIGLAAAIAVLYFVSARISLFLLTELDGVAVFWPAAGVSAGALVALGPSARLPVVVGAMAATVAANLVGDRNLGSAIVFAFCNAGEAVLAAWLIERLFGSRFSLDSFRRVVGLLVAAGVAATASGIGGTFGFVLFHGSTAPLVATWYHWFASDALGILTVAPLIIGLVQSVRNLPKPLELVEGAAVLMVLGAVSAIGFALPTTYWVTILPISLLLPLLFWLAARCGPAFSAAAVFILASMVVWTITFGIGRLGDPTVPIASRVQAGQAALLAITWCALSLAGLFSERRRQQTALAERDAQLALAGQVALVGSFTYNIRSALMHVSPGYAAIHGLPAATEATKRADWRARVYAEDLPGLDVHLHQTMANRRPDHHCEYRIVRPDGEIRWIESRSLMSYDVDGAPREIVGVNIDVTERKRAEQHQRALNAELDHRVKNVLATVSAIIAQTQRTSGSAAEFVAGLDHRIRSLARTHELLSQSHQRGASLEEIARLELAPYSADNAEIGGPSVTLKAEAAQAVAMVLHELTTNAAKYGAFSNGSGRLLLRWWWLRNGSDSRLVIEWQETGGPPVSIPNNLGYGTSIIRELIPYELGGTVDLAFASAGIRCRLELPADGIAAGPLNDGPK